MKRFDELTKSQQEEAIQYAIGELTNNISEGFISVDRPLTAIEIRDFALGAAEAAYYSQPSDQVVDGIVGEDPFL